MSVNKAMILAAGRGERLRPITDETPKPLIQVGTCTLIEHHLLSLSRSGIHEVIINLAYMGDKIKTHLGSGAKYGLDIHYSYEPEGALETAGGIRHALPLLGDTPFLVVNGDIRCSMDFSTLSLGSDRNMHLIMVKNPTHNAEGDFYLDQSTEPGMLEKIHKGSPENYRVTFSGIGIYRPSIFEELPSGRSRLAPLIHEQIKQNKASAELFDGYWTDVGTPERLKLARDYEDAQASS